MKYFKNSSANLIFSSLLVISSFLYSQQGWAMDTDCWTDLYIDEYLDSKTNMFNAGFHDNVPETQSQQPPTVSHDDESTQGKKKRPRDLAEESVEFRPSKYQRTQEGDGTSEKNNLPSSSVTSSASYEQRTEPVPNTSSSSASLPQDSVTSFLAEGDKFKGEDDIDQALRYYEMAAAQGSLEAYVKAAYIYYRNNEDEDSNDSLLKAMTYLKKAGPETAKIHLTPEEVAAIIKEYIYLIPKDKIDFQTLVKFCQSYSSESVFNIILGTLYVCGKGVEKDEDKALEHFKNADKAHGELDTIYQAALALLGDRGAEDLYALLEKFPDREQAIKFLQKAVDRKNIYACFKIINLYSSNHHGITLTALKKAKDFLDEVTYESVGNGSFDYKWNDQYSIQSYQDLKDFPLFNRLRQVYAFSSPFYDHERFEKFMKLGAKTKNEECIELCAQQPDRLKAFKYMLCLSKPEEYQNRINDIVLSMDCMAEAADADLLDSKQLYTLGKMHSYIVRNKMGSLHFLHELPQDDRDEAKNRMIAKHYNLGMKYLQQAVKKSQDAFTRPGKPYLQLAKLVLAQHNPEDLDKGIEYGTLAYDKDLDKALHLCGQLCVLKKQPQMAGSYFFRSFTKGFSPAKKVLRYFKFEKSTSSGSHSSHVLPVFDYNDPFEGKIRDLILLGKEQYLTHTDEPLFSASSGVTVSLSTDKKKTDGLGPLYKTLHDFGENLQESARDLLAAESSRVGLLVANVKIQMEVLFSRSSLDLSDVREPDNRPVFTYSDEGEAAEKGFRIVTVKDQELSCLGEGNPERGTKFHKLMTTWKKDAYQAIVDINNIYTQKLNCAGLNATEKAQLLEEQQKLPALKQAIDDGVNVLERIAHTRAPARAQAMEREYPSLFKD